MDVALLVALFGCKTSRIGDTPWVRR